MSARHPHHTRVQSTRAPRAGQRALGCGGRRRRSACTGSTPAPSSPTQAPILAHLVCCALAALGGLGAPQDGRALASSCSSGAGPLPAMGAAPPQSPQRPHKQLPRAGYTAVLALQRASGAMAQRVRLGLVLLAAAAAAAQAKSSACLGGCFTAATLGQAASCSCVKERCKPADSTPARLGARPRPASSCGFCKVRRRSRGRGCKLGKSARGVGVGRGAAAAAARPPPPPPPL